MLNTKNIQRLFSFLAISLFPVSLFGHHGIANFDLNRDVSFSGEISDIAFVNPHSWIYVQVAEIDGSMVEWKCELRGSTVLRRSGWSREMFSEGENVSITGAPDRFEENTCYMGSITFENGLQMNRYGQLSRAERVAQDGGQGPFQSEITQPSRTLQRRDNGVPDISGDWAAEQRVMTDPRGISGALLPISTVERLEPGELPVGGRAFPGARGTPESLALDPIETAWGRPSPMQLTDAGRRAIADFDPASTDNPRLRCEPTNILFDWSFETVPNRIFQEDGEIRMTYGAMSLERTIHLQQSEFPGSIVPSRAGYSIGRWQDDSLVVETKGFLPGILLADGATPHSAELAIIEVFSLENEGNALVRRYSAEDPLYFEGRFSSLDIVYPSDLPWEPFNCDDRSYRSDQ